MTQEELEALNQEAVNDAYENQVRELDDALREEQEVLSTPSPEDMSRLADYIFDGDGTPDDVLNSVHDDDVDDGYDDDMGEDLEEDEEGDEDITEDRFFDIERPEPSFIPNSSAELEPLTPPEATVTESPAIDETTPFPQEATENARSISFDEDDDIITIVQPTLEEMQRRAQLREERRQVTEQRRRMEEEQRVYLERRRQEIAQELEERRLREFEAEERRERMRVWEYANHNDTFESQKLPLYESRRITGYTNGELVYETRSNEYAEYGVGKDRSFYQALLNTRSISVQLYDLLIKLLDEFDHHYGDMYDVYVVPKLFDAKYTYTNMFGCEFQDGNTYIKYFEGESMNIGYVDAEMMEGTNITSTLTAYSFYFVIKYDNVAITNSFDVTHNIKDLYVAMHLNTGVTNRGGYDTDGNLLLKLKTYFGSGMSGVRSKLSYDEYAANYIHSHLSRRTGNNITPFTNGFCMGSTPISDAFAHLGNDYILEYTIGEDERMTSGDEEINDEIMSKIGILLHQIDDYVRWESIEGVPFIKIADISTATATALTHMPVYSGTDAMNHYKNHVSNFEYEADKHMNVAITNMGRTHKDIVADYLRLHNSRTILSFIWHTKFKKQKLNWQLIDGEYILMDDNALNDYILCAIATPKAGDGDRLLVDNIDDYNYNIDNFSNNMVFKLDDLGQFYNQTALQTRDGSRITTRIPEGSSGFWFNKEYITLQLFDPNEQSREGVIDDRLIVNKSIRDYFKKQIESYVNYKAAKAAISTTD